jgi:hypothetical protein
MNWTHETDYWRPIETLAPSYKGPVVFANDDKTVIWFSEKGDRAQIENKVHKRDEGGTNSFLFDGKGEPVVETVKVKPAWWVMARVTD